MKYLNLVIFLTPIIVFSQSLNKKKPLLPSGLSLSNQFEYSYNTDLDQEILENWFNLDYHKGIFTTGIRFEIFQPNDPNPAISRGKEKYADISYQDLKTNMRARKITRLRYFIIVGTIQSFIN